MELTNLLTERFDIGRAAIFRFAPEGGTGQRTDGSWDTTVPLFAGMEHIGTTEGEVMIEPNEEFSDLTIEVLGPAILKRYLNGEAPSFEVGVFPDPDKMQVFSPSGTASMGAMRRRPVRVHTLWIVPEELFLAPSDDGTNRMVPVPITYAGGEFLKDGVALTAEEQDLLDMSVVIWRAQFGRAMPAYRHDDGGKSLRTVTVTVLHDLSAPDGAQQILAMSEVDLFDVDFEGGS